MIIAPSHTCAIASQKLTKPGFEIPYSPDLAPSDFHLFPNFKKKFGWNEILVRGWSINFYEHGTNFRGKES